MIQSDFKKKLKAKAKLLEPVIRVGKNGLTGNMFIHVNNLLKKRKLIKIKFLKSFADANDAKKAMDEIAEKLSAEIVEKVGFTVVLYRYAQPKKRGDDGTRIFTDKEKK